MAQVYNSSNLLSNQYLLSNFMLNSSNENLQQTTNVGVTSYLCCESGDTIVVGESCVNIWFYDSKFSNLSSQTGNNIATFTAPDNAKYFRVSAYINNNKVITIDVTKATSYTDRIVNETLFFDSATTELATKAGYTIYQGNELTVNNATCLTDYLSVTAGDILRYYGKTPGGYCGYYNDSNTIVGFDSMGGQDDISVVPSNATKTKLGWTTDTGIKGYKITISKGEGAGGGEEEPKTLTSISAIYTQGSTTIYPSTGLDSLKSNLVVTASYSDSSSSTLSSSDYTLSGSLSVGTSTITVSYSGKTTTFTVNVTEEPVATINLVLSTTSLSINENGTGTFTVKLDKQPSTTTTVSLSVNNGNATIDKTSLTFTTSNYSTTQTVTVTGVHNSSSYSNLSSIITLSATGLSSKTVNVTVVNIDSKPVETTNNNLTRLDRCIQGVETLIFDSEASNNFLIYYPLSLLALNNGFINPSSNTNTTQLIPVEQGDIIKVTAYSGKLIGTYLGAKYDTNRKYISSLSSSDSSYTITIDSSTKYLRFSYYPGSANNKGLKIWITKANVSNQATTGTYVNPSKVLYNNIDLKELINSYEYCAKSRWNNKKWGLLGDSITESNGRTTTNYHHYIAERIHTINYNYGKSGNGFAEEKTRIKELPSDVDFITVFLGINNYLHIHDSQELGTENDTSSSTTVTGQIISFIETLLAKFPSTPIGFITPVPHSTGNNITNETNTQGYKLEELVERIKVICSRYSIPVLDLYHNSNLRPWISSVDTEYFQDGLHPNEKGHELISYKIQEFIETL